MNLNKINLNEKISFGLLLVLIAILVCICFIFIPIHFYNESVNHKNRIEYYKYKIITKGDYYYTNDYEEIGNCIIVNNVKNCGDYKIEIINKE